MRLQCHICGGTYGLNPLPDDPAIAEKWKEAIPDATPDVFIRDFRLCVQHFDPIYVFHRRYLLKWAVPELVYFNGRNWQKDKYHYSPDTSKSKKADRKSLGSMKPSIVSKSASTNIDESPMVLPLPPRREDEPDTDPLALPDPSAHRTPVISHVTSLRQAEVNSSPFSRSNGTQTSHRSNRVSAGSPAMRPSKTAPKNPNQSMKAQMSPKKPKITVKSAAQLSAPQAMSTTAKGVLQVPKDKVAPSPPQLSALKAMSQQPNQVQTMIISPNITEPPRKLQLGSSSAHGPARGKAMLVPDQRQQTTHTDLGQKSAIVQNQSNLFVIENPRTLQSKSKLTSSTSNQPQTKHQTVTNVSSKPSYTTTPQDNRHGPLRPKLPGNHRDASHTNSSPVVHSAAISRDPAKYTERQARQAIANAKHDIEKSNQKARILRKRIDLVKLKVATYEGLIANLVRKNIISTESAKQCRVLEKDLVRHNKRRKLTLGRSNIHYGSRMNDNSRNNSSDSLDSRNARDHDYL